MEDRDTKRFGKDSTNESEKEKVKVYLNEGKYDLKFPKYLKPLEGCKNAISVKLQKKITFDEHEYPTDILAVTLKDGFRLFCVKSRGHLRFYDLYATLLHEKSFLGQQPGLTTSNIPSPHNFTVWKDEENGDKLISFKDKETKDSKFHVTIWNVEYDRKNFLFKETKEVLFHEENQQMFYPSKPFFLGHPHTTIFLCTTFYGKVWRYNLADPTDCDLIFDHGEEIAHQCLVRTEPNQVILAGGEFKGFDFRISRVDVWSKKIITRYIGHKNCATEVTTFVNKYGVEYLLSAGNLRDEFLRIWDLDKGTCLHQIDTDLAIWRISVSRGGCILSAGLFRKFAHSGILDDFMGGICCVNEEEMYFLSMQRGGANTLVWLTDFLVVSGSQGGEILLNRIVVEKDSEDVDLKERMEYIFLSECVDCISMKTLSFGNFKIPLILLIVE